MEEAFPDKDPAALRRLWNDESIRHLLLESIGKVLYNSSQKIYTEDANNQFIALLSQAQFKHNPQECVDVAGLMLQTIRPNQTEILPHAYLYLKQLETLHGGPTSRKRQGDSIRSRFGGECLVSLALFTRALKARERAGYPSPSWYRAQGKNALYHARMEDVTHNFERWENYLSENFN